MDYKMQNKLKPYQQYKESGIPWLESIPIHWDVQRTKWLFMKMDRSTREEDDVITCFRDGTVTLRKRRRMTGFTESLKEIGYQGIRKGDLVIHQMDAFAGAVGVSDSDGKGTPVYSVCVPIDEVNSAHFYAGIVREMARSKYILSLAKGIRERSTDFRFETFKNQVLPLPPPAEQNQIARFLNCKTSQIAKFIKAKKQMIELLKEQRQVIINNAVTGKIDVRTGKPYPKYKDSGLEWLGMVPEEWEVRRLTSLLLPGKDGIKIGPFGSSIKSDIIFSKNSFINKPYYKVYGQEHAIRNDFTLGDKYISENSFKNLANYELFPGDIIITMMGTTGRSKVIPEGVENGIMDSHLIRIKVLNNIIKPDFISFLINDTEYIKNQKTFLGKGSIMEGLNSSIIKSFILLVPKIEKQEEILFFLEGFS